MLNAYVPAGVASLEKTMMRHMEKMGESITDFASDQVIQNMSLNKSSGQIPQNRQPVTQGQQGATYRD